MYEKKVRIIFIKKSGSEKIKIILFQIFINFIGKK